MSKSKSVSRLLRHIADNDVTPEQADRAIKAMNGELLPLPEGVKVADCPRNMRVTEVLFRHGGDYIFAAVPREQKGDKNPQWFVSDAELAIGPEIAWMQYDTTWGTSYCYNSEPSDGTPHWTFHLVGVKRIDCCEFYTKLLGKPTKAPVLERIPDDEEDVLSRRYARLILQFGEGHNASVSIYPLEQDANADWKREKQPNGQHVEPTVMLNTQIAGVIDGKALIVHEIDNGFRYLCGDKKAEIKSDGSIDGDAIVGESWFDEAGKFNLVAIEERSGDPGRLFHIVEGELKPRWLERPKNPFPMAAGEVETHGTVFGHGRLLYTITSGKNVYVCDLLNGDEVKLDHDAREFELLAIDDGFVAVFRNSARLGDMRCSFIDKNLARNKARESLGNCVVIRQVGNNLLALQKGGREFMWLKLAGPDENHHIHPRPHFTSSDHQLFGPFDRIQATKDGELKTWHWVDGTFYIVTYK